MSSANNKINKLPILKQSKINGKIIASFILIGQYFIVDVITSYPKRTKIIKNDRYI